MSNCLLQTFLEQLEPNQLTRFQHLIVLMFGIISPTQSNSCRAIGSTIPGSPDGSNLNDSLRNHSGFYEELFLSLLHSCVIWMLSNAHPRTPIYISIDDTFIPKSSRQKSLDFAYYCGHKKKCGFYMVAAHLQVGKYHLPLGFRIYRPQSGVSKQDLALSILNEIGVFLEGFTNITVLADSGYSDHRLMKAVIKDMGWTWISALKSNRCCDGNSVERHFRYLPTEEYDPIELYKRSFLCTSQKGRLNHFTKPGLFVVSKSKRSHKPVSWRYYYSSNPTLSAKKVLEIYGNRWRIENDFWTLKEQLNLNEFVFQREEAVESYLHVVYITFLWIAQTKNQQTKRCKRSSISYGYGEVISGLRMGLQSLFGEYGERSIRAVVGEFVKQRLQTSRRE